MKKELELISGTLMETREELIAKTAKSVFWEQQQKREKRDSIKKSPKDMALSGFMGY
jgi:hypothetical protein